MNKVYVWKIIDETIFGAMLFAIKQIEVTDSFGKNIDHYMSWKVKWQKDGYDFTEQKDEIKFLERIIKKLFRLSKDTKLVQHDGNYNQSLNKVVF